MKDMLFSDTVESVLLEVVAGFLMVFSDHNRSKGLGLMGGTSAILLAMIATFMSFPILVVNSGLVRSCELVGRCWYRAMTFQKVI